MKKLSLFMCAIMLSAMAFAGTTGQEYSRYDFENHYCIPEVFNVLETRTTPPMYNATTGDLTLRNGIVVNLKTTVAGQPGTIYQNLTDLGNGRLAAMDSAGIYIAILGSYICMAELGDDAYRLARVSNDSVSAAVKRNPTRIMGAITLPMNNADSAVTELIRCANKKVTGSTQKIFRCVMIESNFGPDNAPLWDVKYDTIFKTAAQLNLAIYIHPNTPTVASLLDNGVNYALSGLGWGQDIIKTLIRLEVKNTIFDRYPNLRIILGNYGGFLPFDVERSDLRINPAPDPNVLWKQNTCYYTRHRNLLMSTSCNTDTNAYACARQVFDHTCMVFGSDYPFESYPDAVNAIESMSLPTQESKDFWQKTAEKYVVNKTTNWSDTIAAHPFALNPKTPTVTGYDFEHHSYIQPFIDTLMIRTTAPYYLPDANEFFVHDQVAMYGASFMFRYLTDFSQQRVDTLNSAAGTTNFIAVVSTSEGIADLPAEQAIPLARMTNDSIYALGQRYPGRFRGEMCLPLQNVDSSLAEMRRCAQLGFRVWCVPAYGGTTEQNAIHIYEPQFEPLLAEAEKLGITLYAHPQISLDADFQDMGYMVDAAGIGFTLENMRTITRLIMNGTFDRYPNLRLVIAHMGEYFPFMLDRMDKVFAPGNGDPFVKNQHPFSWYFDNRNLLVSTSGLLSKASFDQAVKVLGVDDIIYGSDYPYEDYKYMCDFFKSMDITQNELNQIWGENAEEYIFYALPSSIEDVNSSVEAARVTKFCKDGVLYIQRGTKIYDILGSKVK